MAVSQGLLFWLLVNNLESNLQYQPNIWRRSLESYSEACPSYENRELNSFLWFMDRNPPVYFFGTIHVPYTKVWDHIPLNSKRAFNKVNRVYFELDLTDRDNLKTLQRCKSLPNGVKLRDVLPTTLYKRIKSHLSYIRKRLSEWITFEQKVMGLSPLQVYQQLTKNWHKKRPIWIMMMLDRLTEYHVKLLAQEPPVLDKYLMNKAVYKQKTLGSIETVEEQCDVLNNLNTRQVILALNQTVTLHEKIRRGEKKLSLSTKQLIYHYNCGDLSEVLFSQDISGISNIKNISESNSVEKEQAKKFEEYMKEELFFKRNRKMAKRIVKIVKEEPKRSLIFLLGVGHFLGNKSIINILQSQGYEITHLKANDPLPRYGPRRQAKDCKKWKQKKGKKNDEKQRRKGYRTRKQCNNDILSKKLLITPKTTLCTSCTTKDVVGQKQALSSSASIYGGQQLRIIISILVLIIKIAGI